MGLVGAGTNNARLAQMLRQLAVYYQKDANALFMVRQAQGFVHLGKGTLTLNPFQADKSLMNVAATAALISTAVTCLDSRQLILGKNHFLLYSIVPAIQVSLGKSYKIALFWVSMMMSFDTFSATLARLSRWRVPTASSICACWPGRWCCRSSR